MTTNLKSSKQGRENIILELPLNEVSNVTGIRIDDIKAAILEKRVFAYRIIRPEINYQSWVVNLNSLKLAFPGHFRLNHSVEIRR